MTIDARTSKVRPTGPTRTRRPAGLIIPVGRFHWVVGVLLLLFVGVSRGAAQGPSDSPHGRLAQPCTSCHSSNGWVPAVIDTSFRHEGTGFPLAEGHAAVGCRSCHSSLEFERVATTCVGCHRDIHQSQFGTGCAQCHTTRTFDNRPDQLRQHALNLFPLEGAHRAVDCASCHVTGAAGSTVFRGTATECISCHKGDFDQTSRPNHPAAQFATNCTSCHTTTVWLGAPYDHEVTEFPLTGGHTIVDCQGCHSDGIFVGKPTSCVSCHQSNYAATVNPPHTNGFPTTCTDCHTTTTWSGALFDHDNTQFPLIGAHGAAICQDCHADGVYRGRPATCMSCHGADFDRALAPNHQTAQFPATCADCHTNLLWAPSTFEHSATQFPLTGAHQAVTCQACHLNGWYQGLPTSCVACHQANYNTTTIPPHQAAGFPTTCTDCHTTTIWTGAPFDHSTTQFALTGSHQAVTCQSCHGDGVYRGKPATCVSCHQTNYNGTVDPPHQAAGFPTTCTDCHTTTIWTGAPFDHGATAFPLTGSHQAVTCQSCHGDGVYRGKPTACVSCHQTTYNGTVDPPHQAAGFPTDCTTCHTTTAWKGAPFDHGATAFPLTGSHQAVTCQACHADGVYRGKPTTCVSCHQTTYNGTTNPPHQAAGFPTTCSDCHTTTVWSGAPFNHGATQFPLTGAHLAATCQACHADGVYRGKPTACVSCHQIDYNGTRDPNHLSAGFPTDCLSCHTTSRWLGATFNHDTQWFPVYSGRHRNLWTTCSQCHTNPAAYSQFTCLTCHGQSKMADVHSGRSGYSYNSAACLSCHPRP